MMVLTITNMVTGQSYLTYAWSHQLKLNDLQTLHQMGYIIELN